MSRSRYRGFTWKVPGWFHREFIQVPQRSEERRLARLLVRGDDPEAVIWPKPKRPQRWYW